MNIILLIKLYVNGCCRMNENIVYDVLMGCIIIILNILAQDYIIINKISFTSPGFLILSFISANVYVFLGQVIESMDSLPYPYFLGRTLHTMGFGCFLDFLYCISPHLGLYMGLPCLLWFIVFMIGPCICTLVQKLRDWWKFGRIPQSASDGANIAV